jgi:hypothetical protein
MKRIIVGVLASVFAATAVLGVALRTTGGDETDVGPNRLVNRAGLIDANNSPSVVRDPRAADTVVMSHRVDRPRFSAGLDWSADGGRTWKSTALRLPPGLDRPYAPDIAFAPDGTLYVTYVNLTGAGNVPANLWLARSTDGGRTLSAPVRIAGKLTFQARVAVDRRGAVHIIWLQAPEVGLLSLAGSPSPIVEARSTDGGRTFSRPQRVSDPARELVGAASPVIDGDGQLAVLYEDFKGDRRDFQNLEGPPWDQPFALVLTRPVGSTFATGVELDRRVVPTRRFLAFLPEFPSLAAGPGDTLYVAWSDGRNGDDDVFLRRSGDDGRTWSSAKRVNDNPKGDGTSQYLPRVDVAPDGRVDVIYLDRRRDRKNVLTDATLASSDDDGASFRNVRLSSRSFDARVGARAAQQLPVDFGSRLGLDSGTDGSVAAWTDSRLGTSDTGRQDIFSAVFETSPRPVLERAPVIAVLLVLALACVALLALGRRKESPEPAR